MCITHKLYIHTYLECTIWFSKSRIYFCQLYLVSPECWEKMKMNANMHFFPQMWVKSPIIVFTVKHFMVLSFWQNHSSIVLLIQILSENPNFTSNILGINLMIIIWFCNDLQLFYLLLLLPFLIMWWREKSNFIWRRRRLKRFLHRRRILPSSI